MRGLAAVLGRATKHMKQRRFAAKLAPVRRQPRNLQLEGEHALCDTVPTRLSR
jgi:hypothetical protein